MCSFTQSHFQDAARGIGKLPQLKHALWLRHSVSASLRAYSAAAEARAMAASRSARAASRCSKAESLAVVLEEAALPACSCASLSRRSLSRTLACRMPIPFYCRQAPCSELLQSSNWKQGANLISTPERSLLDMPGCNAMKRCSLVCSAILQEHHAVRFSFMLADRSSEDCCCYRALPAVCSITPAIEFIGPSNLVTLNASDKS